MAKAKKSVQSQAARIMEAKKKAGANQGGQKFAQAMGKNEGAIKALQYRAVRALHRLLPEGIRS